MDSLSFNEPSVSPLKISKDQLDFEPKITLEEGIKLYIPEIKRLFQAELK